MLEAAKKNPIVVGLGVGIAVMAGVAVLRQFVNEDAPWLLEVVSPLLRTEIVAGVGLGFLLALAVDNLRLRDTLRWVIRDYYAEKSDLEHRLDPEHYGPVSARVGAGKADPVFEELVRNRYRQRGE